jgi:hypothetical protein
MKQFEIRSQLTEDVPIANLLPSLQKKIHHALWNCHTSSIFYVRNEQLFNPKTKRYATEKNEQSQP